MTTIMNTTRIAMIILTAIMIIMTVTMIGLDYFMTIIHGIGTFFVGFKVTKNIDLRISSDYMKYVISLILPHVICYFLINLPRTVCAEPDSVQFEQIHVTCTVVNERTCGPSVLRRPLKTSATSWLSPSSLLCTFSHELI
jgi:hypothetical protein